MLSKHANIFAMRILFLHWLHFEANREYLIKRGEKSPEQRRDGGQINSFTGRES
jgi:hypothetical protein